MPGEFNSCVSFLPTPVLDFEKVGRVMLLHKVLGKTTATWHDLLLSNLKDQSSSEFNGIWSKSPLVPQLTTWEYVDGLAKFAPDASMNASYDLDTDGLLGLALGEVKKAGLGSLPPMEL